ncbi:hypothetical protein FB451DRAFT_1373097 [Mycena latifolia]|nr:hypothetical protein FB451DRAFT_1373097 [Mycena latifolia]
MVVFQLQELCDQIACHIALHDSSQADLKSTALVCQTLCSSAQSQIFRHVELDPWALPQGFMHDVDTALAAGASAARRLSAVLTASPHLLRHIRDLSVLAGSEILEFVSNLRFPLLRKIKIGFQTIWPDENVLRLSRDLIGLPSIREVEIVDLHIGIDVPDDPRLNFFPSLFETCTRDISSLAFISVIPSSALPTTSAPRPTGQRAQINRLRLRWSERLGNWLISPSCPFDFTHLVDFETDATRKNSDMLQVLTVARLSIIRLQMIGDLAFLVNFSEFPTLTCLEVYYSNYEAIATLHPNNRVATIGLHAPVGAFEALEEFKILGLEAPIGFDSVSSADAFIAKFPLPSLRQVEVQIYGPSNDSFGFKMASVIDHFPQLASKGLLVVTDRRHYDPYI